MTPKKPNKIVHEHGLAVGAAIGVAFGAIFGANSEDMPMSIALGLCVGTAFGALVDFIVTKNKD
jgi:ABC-type uncharacterized transport system permease subunit